MASENLPTGAGRPSFFKKTLLRVQRATVDNATKLVVSVALTTVAAVVMPLVGHSTPKYPALIAVPWQEIVAVPDFKQGDTTHCIWSHATLLPVSTDNSCMELVRPTQVPVLLKFDPVHSESIEFEFLTLGGLIVGKRHQMPICRFETRITINDVLELRLIDESSQVFETMWFRNRISGLKDYQGLTADEVHVLSSRTQP